MEISRILSFPRIGQSRNIPPSHHREASAIGAFPLLKSTSSPAHVPRFAANTTDEFHPHEEDEWVPVQMKLPKAVWERFQQSAKTAQMTTGEYFVYTHPQFTVDKPTKTIVAPVTDVVTGFHHGKPVQTAVTSLMGGEQIFDKWVEMLEKTEHYAQISMYDFQNLMVPGGRPSEGAEVSPGWKKQQQILPLLIEKARKGVRFQIILDNSAIRLQDEYGNAILPRPINNAPMIAFLEKLKKEEGLPIDVVAFPRKVAKIYHVKMLVSDGKRAIVGGMNLSNHSAANWDACVALEGPEVANLQKDTFEPDWILANAFTKALRPDQSRTMLPTIQPVSDPAIKILNTFQREYTFTGHTGKEEILDYITAKLNSPDLKALHSEQFIATHKPILEKLHELYDKGLSIQMLHSASVLDQFPTTRKPVFNLMKKGDLIRFYNEWKEIKQKLHAKWTVFNDDEVIIGSANLSAAGIQSNNNPDHVRGNRDMAIVIRSKKLAEAFLKQFQYDWDYSPPQRPDGHGQHEKAAFLPNFTRVAQKLLEALS